MQRVVLNPLAFKSSKVMPWGHLKAKLLYIIIFNRTLALTPKLKLLGLAFISKPIGTLHFHRLMT
jgi:hypothetical protein